jgi:hypothetical protein
MISSPYTDFTRVALAWYRRQVYSFYFINYSSLYPITTFKKSKWYLYQMLEVLKSVISNTVTLTLAYLNVTFKIIIRLKFNNYSFQI